MLRKTKTPLRGKKTKLPDPSLEDWPENFYQVDVRTGVPYSPSSEPPKTSGDSLAISAPLLPPHMRAKAPNLDKKLEKKFMDLRAEYLGSDERLRYPGMSVQNLFPDMFPSRQPQSAPVSPPAAGPSRAAFAGTSTPSPSPSQPSRTNTQIGRPNKAPGTRGLASRRRAGSLSQSSTSAADQRLAGDQALMPPPPVPSNIDTKGKVYDTPPDESLSSESSSGEVDTSKPSRSLWSTGIALDETPNTGKSQSSVSNQTFDMLPALSFLNQGPGVGSQNGNMNGWGNLFGPGRDQEQVGFPPWPNANFNNPNQLGGHSSWIDPSLLNPGLPWPYPDVFDPQKGSTGVRYIDPSLLKPSNDVHHNSHGHLNGAKRKPADEHIPWTNPNAPDPNLARRNSQPSQGFPTFGEMHYTDKPAWSGAQTSAFMGPGFVGHGTPGYSAAGAPSYNSTKIPPFDPGFTYNNIPGFPIAGVPGPIGGFSAAPASWEHQRHPFGASYEQSYLPPQGIPPQPRHPSGAVNQHEYPPPPEPEYVRSRSSSLQTQPPPPPPPPQQQISPYQQGHQPAQPAAANTTTTGAGGHEATGVAGAQCAAVAADDDRPDYLWVPPAGYRHPRTATGAVVRLGTARVAEETRWLVEESRRWPAPRRPAQTFALMWQTAAAGEAFRRGLRGPYVVGRRFVVDVVCCPESIEEPATAEHLATWGRAPDGREAWLDLHGRPTDRVDDDDLIDLQGLYELEFREEEEKGEGNDDE